MNKELLILEEIRCLLEDYMNEENVDMESALNKIIDLQEMLRGE